MGKEKLHNTLSQEALKNEELIELLKDTNKEIKDLENSIPQTTQKEGSAWDPEELTLSQAKSPKVQNMLPVDREKLPNPKEKLTETLNDTIPKRINQLQSKKQTTYHDKNFTMIINTSLVADENGLEAMIHNTKSNILIKYTIDPPDHRAHLTITQNGTQIAQYSQFYTFFEEYTVDDRKINKKGSKNLTNQTANNLIKEIETMDKIIH